MNAQNQYGAHESEHSRIQKAINFRFPHSYKRIGIVAAAGIMLFLLFYKFYGANSLLVKDILRTVMLLCLLVASLSKEKFEDEYVAHVRAQSHKLSFLFALAYSILLPLVSLVMDTLISSINTDNRINFHEVSAFEVIFMIICFQLLFFETLKRLYNAQ